jgi:hypothetical protein
MAAAAAAAALAEDNCCICMWQEGADLGNANAAKCPKVDFFAPTHN